MILIKNGLVLDSKKKEFIKQDVLIDNNKIKDIGNIEADCEIVDATNKYVIPSFIDIHTHGAMGVDFLNATFGNSKELLGHYFDHATKTIYATTVTAPEAQILDAIKNIKEISKQSKINIEGIHIEGPFISKDAPGCHKVSEIRLPTISELDKICEAADGLKLRITVAPEINGAEEFIKEAVKRGINIGIGHSAADGETVKKALSWGANVMIHLYNAMTPLHHRKPGCVGIGLSSDAYTEIICDGHHVNPDVIDLTYQIKGSDKLVLITDSMEATSMPNGKYSIGGIDVYMKDDVVTTENGTLAGSTLNMLQAVKNLMDFANATLADAVICGSLTPAKVVGIDNITGSIEIDKRADISILDKELNFVRNV